MESNYLRFVHSHSQTSRPFPNLVSLHPAADAGCEDAAMSARKSVSARVNTVVLSLILRVVGFEAHVVSTAPPSIEDVDKWLSGGH